MQVMLLWGWLAGVEIFAAASNLIKINVDSCGYSKGSQNDENGFYIRWVKFFLAQLPKKCGLPAIMYGCVPDEGGILHRTA